MSRIGTAGAVLLGAFVMMLVSFPASAGVTVDCPGAQGRGFCPVDTRGGVQLVRQYSRAACIEGRTWGYNRQGIWVESGCRGRFLTGDVRGQPPFGPPGWDRFAEPRWDGPRGRGPGWSNRLWPGHYLACESLERRPARCAADTRGGVRLAEQLSRSPCVEGRTWGYDRSGIWVTNGCRAHFLVGR